MDDSSLPAEFLYSRPKDPAAGTSGAPNYSREILPHVSSVNGRYGLVSYSYLSADQAINDSRANAYRMRNDCGIMESLHARQRAVALQNWSIEPEDSASFEQQQLVRCMTDILQETPRFAEIRLFPIPPLPLNLLHPSPKGQYQFQLQMLHSGKEHA